MEQTPAVSSTGQNTRSGGLPLSFAQQRLWFLDQLEPGSSAYNISRVLRLSGPLNEAALQKALEGMVARHESLRTVFVTVEGSPVQVIQAAGRLELPVVDLRSWQTAAREEEVLRLTTEEAQRPFDLSRDLMLRGRLIRLDAEEQVLLLTMHHIVSDGWSMGILFKELSALYEAFCTGKPARLPELPIQYADYAEWQREWLQGELLDSQLGYWKQQLEGAPQVLELPTDRPRPALQTYRGGRRSRTLSRELSEELKRLSRSEGVTLFMTLLAAFQTLLYRYTGQEEMLVGTPIAGRSREETEGLIGFFVNTLVLRTDLSGHPTFRELLARVRRMAVEAYAHQDLPFEKLVEELHPERDLSRNPLFQVMFVLQTAPRETVNLAGLGVRHSGVDRAAAKFDLTLSILVREEGLEAILEYNTDLYDGATIDRMLGHLQAMLEGVAADRDRGIAELPLLTDQERHQILTEWNATEREYPRDRCLHQLFEEQAARTPAALAVVDEGEKLTYQQLNVRASQLAHCLRKLGVGPEVIVGICLERSVEMVVALLGILKAGGAYLPLDPDYPKERVRFMLQDSGVSVVLTDGNFLEKLSDCTKPDKSGVSNAETAATNRPSSPIEQTILNLNASREILDKESKEPVAAAGTPENLAYVIYTSGSTGRPKGVLITHRGVVNLLDDTCRKFGFGQHDIFLSVTTLSFDIAVLELFLPLSVGARTVIVPRTTAVDGVKLLHTLSTSGATTMQATPATWHLLLEAGWPQGDRLRILCGGEALSRDLARKLLERGSSLWNLYGPTETTVYSLANRVKEVTQETVSIGRPIANTRAYILDSHLQAVPKGVWGELHIGGLGLARGYLNRFDQTAERFIPDLFSDAPGVRLYKTGDIARFRPDGKIEFLGRIDQQVKLRGFRIELGEIEAALREHAAVRDAVVVMREDKPGDKYLAAYLISHKETPPLSSELRSSLQRKLPDYMVPSVFVKLDTLPLTPNGKVDRKALPKPDHSLSGLGTDFVAPRNGVEERMAEIWAQALGLERVGIHDNFFDLGGHSLLAMKLSSRMSAAIQRDITVRSLFLYPSIAALAEAVASFPMLKGGPVGPAAPIRRADRTAAAAEASSFEPSSPHLQIERRSLLSLLGTGKIAPVEAAALSCLSDSILTTTDVTRDEVIHDWHEDLPTLSAITETSMGRVGVITLPRFHSDLYSNTNDLLDLIIEALELARQIGARVVSLTGLLPSATEYGQAVASRIAGRPDLPKITTGHATIAATVALTVRRILEESGRDLRGERVGFLGLGSIGTAALRLLLRCLPHPAEIILCDIYSKWNSLESIKKGLVDELNFRGSVKIMGANAGVPDEFYTSTLIIGATNVPEVLNFGLVKAGTLIVDDRRPQSFKAEEAALRFLAEGDILFTEGDSLQSPSTVTQIRYLPPQARRKLDASCGETFTTYNPFRITGCVLSSLLSFRFEDLKPTVGLTDDRESFMHYQKLISLGFQAAGLHCESFVLPQEQIQNFRRHFGRPQGIGQPSNGSLKSFVSQGDDTLQQNG